FLGRHAEASNDFGSAHAYYEKIGEVFPNHYYGVLARERLAQSKVSGAVAPEKTAKMLGAIAFPPRKAPAGQQTPATATRIERSRLLRTAGLNDLADAELRFGAKSDGQPWLLAMELASSSDAIHQGLRAMKVMAPDYLNLPIESAPRKFWELLFPMP